MHTCEKPHRKKKHISHVILSEVCARERCLRTDRIQTCFRCVSTETTINNTNVMPCENKGREHIRVSSHGYWVKNMCYLLSRCNARALFASLTIKKDKLAMKIECSRPSSTSWRLCLRRRQPWVIRTSTAIRSIT